MFDAYAYARQVKAEVGRIAGARQGETRTFILCPFHNEKTPSGTISHDPTKPHLIGRFRCWGCGEKASWSQLAERLNLSALDKEGAVLETVPKENFDKLDTTLLLETDSVEDVEDARLYEPTDTNCQRAGLKANREGYFWRGFYMHFLVEVGAKLMYHFEHQKHYVYFPVNVRGKEVGYIKAEITKPRSKRPSYLNKPGTWSRSKGLFLYDESIALMHRLNLKTLVLVEGPRDALRLYNSNIPAIAILGTQSWTLDKARLLEFSGASRIVTCFDGDEPGKHATTLIVRAKAYSPKTETYVTREDLVPLQDLIETKVFQLWKYAEGEKVDPFKMKAALVEQLRDLVI